MARTTEKEAKTQDKTTKALERVVNQAVNNDGAVEAYLCTLLLPRQFSSNQHKANDIFKRIQSDFCKHVLRKTGSTPRYVAVHKQQDDRPAYAFCLFTRPEAILAKPEDFAQKGSEIANGKSMQSGWANGKMDVMEVFKDAPRFSIASQPVKITSENQNLVIGQLQEHLQNKSDSTQHQRTLFVSKCQ